MSERPKRIRLGDLLVEHKLISEGQLTAALDEQKNRVISSGVCWLKMVT